MNEHNITQDRAEELAREQGLINTRELDEIMSNKQAYMSALDSYDSKIFKLEKIIRINKRAGNKYAVIRDEIKVKSYKLIRSQNKMLTGIMNALNNTSDSKAFNKELNKFVTKNQLEVQELNNFDYQKILDLKSNSKTIKLLKKNIKEFYALIDINEDFVNHLYLYENKIYILGKYEKYSFLGFIPSLNTSEFAKSVNPILSTYNLDIVKIIFILFSVLVVYFIRKVLYVSVESYLLKLQHVKKYVKDVLDTTHKPIDILIIFINIEIAIFIYNDFIVLDDVNRFFNMSYSFILTLVVYRVLNTISAIKIENIDYKNEEIKHEVINVGIKIINFIIIIIGLLFILYFGGVNLTAVLSGLGIGGFAVALAAKDSLSNFFGTISILLSDTLSQGDWIVVDSNEGVVVEIGLRVTTLRTFDNALISIPNAIVANKEVKNWNKRTLGRRIKMSLGVKYDSKAENINNVVKEIRQMLSEHPKIATENTSYKYQKAKSAKLVSRDDELGVKKTLLVYLDSFSDSSINILVYCFTKTTDWNEWLQIKEDVMYKIMNIFEKNSIEFAFPSLSIYNENEANK